MTEAFTPDPDRLRRLMQIALGDRQIDNVPGYDPGQVLPVVVINASEFPAGGGSVWTPWQSATPGSPSTTVTIPVAENGAQVEVSPVLDQTTTQVVRLNYLWRRLPGIQALSAVPGGPSGNSDVDFAGLIRFIVHSLEPTDTGLRLDFSASASFNVRGAYWRLRLDQG